MDLYIVKGIDNEEYEHFYALYAPSEEEAIVRVNEDNVNRPLRTIAEKAVRVSVSRGAIQEIFDGWRD